MALSGRAARSMAEQINFQINGTTIPKQDCIKNPGVTINNVLSWKSHVQNVRRRMLAAIAIIRRGSQPTDAIQCNAPLLPCADYCSVVWHSCNFCLSQNLEQVHNLGMRVILAKPLCTKCPITLHTRHHI